MHISILYIYIYIHTRYIRIVITIIILLLIITILIMIMTTMIMTLCASKGLSSLRRPGFLAPYMHLCTPVYPCIRLYAPVYLCIPLYTPRCCCFLVCFFKTTYVLIVAVFNPTLHFSSLGIIYIVCLSILYIPLRTPMPNFPTKIIPTKIR